ncbi:hypothetical protein FHS79_000406 [Polymorphobacter multimanifer]|uniref:Ribose-phosphate pyrophosphokinase n=1 Tax=Polymorphobacter multimanifer TaxID=1070431 RepID=A0A841L5L3_9SPHN|nr:ribose-phosphate pyrophosphokinase [Polymorphobacter multimanifer]MBB6226253.1 hypothetical protein [Polymorphobacter multimanifer]
MNDALFDIDAIEALLRDAALRNAPLTYAEALAALGHPFSRPHMRALCKAIDHVDARAAAAGEPELAVLVVRASDGLPGQGWWVGRPDWHGKWEGPEAMRHVRALQAAAHAYWRRHRL